MIVKKLKKMPKLVHMSDVLNFSPIPRFMMEQALLEFTMRNKVENSLFLNSSGVKDYIINVEYLGHPLPI